MLDRGQAPYTLEEHVNSLVGRVERVERRPLPTSSTQIYVQPGEPLGAPVGTLWFDTDETCT